MKNPYSTPYVCNFCDGVEGQHNPWCKPIKTLSERIDWCEMQLRVLDASLYYGGESVEGSMASKVRLLTNAVELIKGQLTKEEPCP